MSLGKSECVSFKLPRITELVRSLSVRIVTYVTGLLYKKIGLINMPEKKFEKREKNIKENLAEAEI